MARHPALLPASLAIGLIMAGASAATIALASWLLDEAASPRIAILTLIAAFGGLLLGVILSLVAGFALRWLPRWLALPFAGLVAIPGIMASIGGCFALYTRLIDGRVETEPWTRDWFSEIGFSTLGAGGLFIQTGTKYVLPWGAPALALLFTLLCFALLPRD
jgi:hypothetical protein